MYYQIRVYTLRIHNYCCVSKLSEFGAYLYAVNDNTVVYINNAFNFFVFEKFLVITFLYTFRRRERIHPRGTECLPF